MLFICPKCASRFVHFNSNSAVCEKGHSYDKSRDGYYNFLLPSGKKTHGDNKQMLLARRDFLDTGAYFPLAEAVCRLILKYAPKKEVSLLDIGCGEGYYTKIVKDKTLARISAFDVSKDAVRLTAKRVGGGDFCVASAYRIPALRESFDIALNMFSPLALSETLRVLKNDGIFVMAIPDREHLFELKAAIYDTPYKNEVADFALAGFTLLEAQRISYKMHLRSKKEILSLFTMTPYAYRTKPGDAERLLSLENLDVTASFVVIVYKKSCQILTSGKKSV